MLQSFDTFQGLFKSTDEFFGLTQPLPVPQSDTSAFDAIVQKDDGDDKDDSKPSKITLDSVQIEHLRSTINRVKVQREKESTIIGRCVENPRPKAELLAELNALQKKVLLNANSNWQDEVLRAMECDSEEDLESDEERPAAVKRPQPSVRLDLEKNLFKPKLRLSDNLNAFDCFESDYVEVDKNGLDPLDVLIPNVDRQPDEWEEESEEEESPARSKKSAARAANNDNELETKSGASTAAAASSSSAKPPAAPAASASTGLTLKLNRQSLGGNNTAAIAAASAPDPAVAEEDPYRSKSEKERIRKMEKAQRIRDVDMGFNAAASIEANMLLGKRGRDFLPSHKNRVRSLIAALNHSTIATSHKNTKPDLTALELKYFHRPHMIRERDRTWQISCKNTSSGGSGGSGASKKPGNGNLSPLHRSGGGGGGSSSSSSVRMQYSEADKQNLSLAHNKVDFLLLEYIEEFPPMMLNFGMASTVFNYYRSPKNVDEEEERRMKQRQEDDKLYDNVLSTASACRLPRHVMLLLQLRTQKPQYDYDLNIPRLSLGETKVLNEEDESPFLGTIADGEIQQAFVNNLFKAPIFRHSPHKTDFLLIRTKLLQKQMTFAIREIPYIYLCGQLEPQKIVPRPISRITSIQEKFYMLAVSRYLQTNFDGVEFGDIMKHVLKYCLKDKTTPHKSQHRQKLKDIAKKVADECKDTVSGGYKWFAKEFDEDDDGGALGGRSHAGEIEQRYTSEEIAKSFSPEDVCLQESCNAAEYHLYQQHITDVDLSKIEAWLTLMHKIKQGKMDRAQRVKRLISEYIRTQPQQVPVLERLLKILVKEMQRLEQKMNIARFIFDRLVRAPWNTTEAYVKSHIERDGQGKMELLGIGDPSGIGEGYAFVRILKTTTAGTAVKKNTVKLVSTDKDLRKLTKKDQIHLLLGFGIKESQILSLRRWDRVHMIREFSTMAEKTGVAKSLHKYARGDANKSSVAATGMSALESFGEKCEQIWKRQKASLSRTVIPAAAASTTSAASASQSKKNKRDENNLDSSSSSDSDSSDDDIEDFAKDIERTLNARAVATATMEANETARLEKEKKQLEDEKKEYSSIKSFMNNLNGAPSTVSSGGAGANRPSTITTSGGSGTGQPSSSAITPRLKLMGPTSAGGAAAVVLPSGGSSSSAAAPTWVRPRRVVKRVHRSVNAEGVETIRVEFLFSEKEVNRVDYANAKMKKERELKRSGTAGTGTEGTGADEELEESQIGTTMATMNLKLSKMKKMVDQNHQQQKRERNGLLVGIDPEEAYAMKQMKSTKRSNVVTPLSYRLPRVSLAVRLEKELLSLWMCKNASWFWYPVSRAEPGYYERISNPICLRDIRDKISSFQYETAAGMIRDVELMARNASDFNGEKSIFATTAYKLLDQLKTSINHEQVHFGVDKDTIRLMEEAIKKKNIQYGNAGSSSSSSSSSGVPAVARQSSMFGFSAVDSMLDMNRSGSALQLNSSQYSAGGAGAAAPVEEEEDIMDTDGLNF